MFTELLPGNALIIGWSIFILTSNILQSSKSNLHFPKSLTTKIKERTILMWKNPKEDTKE
jgi:hypothetical protein